jgi:hypothetical protein
MVRKQIHITTTEQKSLRALSKRTGRSQSELIRAALDSFLAGGEQLDRVALLVRGLWRDRRDLPDFEALRKGFDRLN